MLFFKISTNFYRHVFTAINILCKFSEDIFINECDIPDGIPHSDRHWLLVAWSADFASVGPTLACQPLLRLDIFIFCQRWANIGPTVDFYSRWRRAIIGHFGKLFIMVCLKILFSVSPQISTKYLTILDIK